MTWLDWENKPFSCFFHKNKNQKEGKLQFGKLKMFLFHKIYKFNSKFHWDGENEENEAAGIKLIVDARC